MAHLPLGEWALLRGEVASFFQSARVKLSVLVSSGVQAPDGTLTKPIVGMLPRGQNRRARAARSVPRARSLPRRRCAGLGR